MRETGRHGERRDNSHEPLRHSLSRAYVEGLRAGKHGKCKGRRRDDRWIVHVGAIRR